MHYIYTTYIYIYVYNKCIEISTYMYNIYIYIYIHIYILILCPPLTGIFITFYNQFFEEPDQKTLSCYYVNNL